jgi:predicted amidohydrolase
MPGTATLAALQTAPQATMADALEHALTLAREAVAAGATFLATPEYCGGLAMDDGRLAPPHAPEAEHEVLRGMQRFAREAGVWTLVGSVAVTAPGGRIANRGFLLDAGGAIRARYDKIHMFDIQLSETEVYRESATIAPGHSITVTETPAGLLGHTICYDLRFAALYRALAQAGAEILAVPSAFLQTTGAAHWHILCRARAIETGAFVLAPGAVGPVPGGGAVYGHSLIVDPWGTVLAEGGSAPGVVLAEIDRDQVAATRGRIPALSHDRAFDLAAAQADLVCPS